MANNTKSVMPDRQFQVGPNERPPSYSSQGSDTSVKTFKTKPTNFSVYITEDNRIRGEFVIDPSLRLPYSMLPPLRKGETEADRKNLLLMSSFSIDADIWLLAPPSVESAMGIHNHRTSIALTAGSRWIDVQVHALDGAAPFLLTANALQYSCTSRIALPRSFEGFIELSTKSGGITLSDGILQNAARISQLGNKWQYFVGDMRNLGGEEWEGSHVEVDAPYGWIQIKYIDETVPVQGREKLFTWLFGK